MLIRGCTALVLIVAGVALMRAQSPNRQVLPVPDIPGYRTLKGDFHLHTVFSDGNVWPTVRVQEAWRDGLDVIALTEHVEYHPHAADVKTDDARSFAIAKPLADQLGILLIPGVEITKPDPPKTPLVLADGSLHFNALFVTDAAALYVPVDHMEALRRARAQGAFVFWNHPRYRVPLARWFPQVARAHAEGLFQGMELVNGPEFYEEAHPWIDQRQLAILANSDAHDPVPPRSPAGPHRPITLLFARTADLDGVRDAFVSRRTAAWMGDEVWGMEEHLRALFHAAVAIETPALTRKAGAAPVLRIRNRSAIPMRLAVRHAPSWFVLVPPVELGAESLTVLRPGFSAPPAGEHRIELQLEVLNLHAAPGRNLTVTVPLRVVISP